MGIEMVRCGSYSACVFSDDCGIAEGVFSGR